LPDTVGLAVWRTLMQRHFCTDVINVETKIKKNVKNVKKRGENKKNTFVNVG